MIVKLLTIILFGFTLFWLISVLFILIFIFILLFLNFLFVLGGFLILIGLLLFSFDIDNKSLCFVFWLEIVKVLTIILFLGLSIGFSKFVSITLSVLFF